MERTGSEDDLKTTDGQVSDQQDSASSSLKGTASVVDLSLEGGRQSSVVTARGTADGLVIRLDGRVDKIGLREALEEFLHARKAFLSGHEISFEWVGVRPSENIVEELSSLLYDKFSIKVKSSRMRDPQARVGLSKDMEISSDDAVGRGNNLINRSIDVRSNESRGPSLFDGMEGLGKNRDEPLIGGAHSGVGGRAVSGEAFWDDPDARIVYATLRSGQKIETDHSLVIMGDVNSGAEIIAGGDIIVLGTLRGVAHAGAYDETGGGRIIFALNLQATQLRIGMVISRGSSESQRQPEIARVEGGLIVVETYTAKSLASRRRE